MSDEWGDSESIETVSTPRLTIFHLLVLTAAIALMLALSRAVVEDDPTARWYDSLAYLVGATSCGTGLAGAAFIMSRWIRGTLRPMQPGEWLLVILATEGLTFFVGGLLWKISPNNDSTETLVNLLWTGSGAAIAILAAWFCRRMAGWRWFFGLRAGLLTTGFLLTATYSLGAFLASWWLLYSSWFEPLLCLTLLFAMVVRDWKCGYPRAWLHWLGVAAFLAGQLVFLGNLIRASL